MFARLMQSGRHLRLRSEVLRVRFPHLASLVIAQLVVMRNSSVAERRSHKPLVAGSSPASAMSVFASVLVYLSWQRVRLLIGMSLVRVQPPEPNLSGESLNLERSVQRARYRRRGSDSRSLCQVCRSLHRLSASCAHARRSFPPLRRAAFGFRDKVYRG
jgi:hypothetical protein